MRVHTTRVHRVHTARVHERAHWKWLTDYPQILTLFETWELSILCVPWETKLTDCPFQRGMETLFSVKTKDFDFQSEINLGYQDVRVIIIL